MPFRIPLLQELIKSLLLLEELGLLIAPRFPEEHFAAPIIN